MELRFGDNRLLRRFEREDRAIRRWGRDVGRRYVERVHFIRGLDTWDDLFRFQFLHCHPLRHGREGQYSIRLTGRWRLIVEPVADSARALRIAGVEDYHG